MIIYLVRHAEPESRKGLSDGEKVEIGLSRYGKLQAEATAKALKRLGVKKIYSSPIMRAKETAKVISEYVGSEVEYEDNLKEFFTNLKEMDSKEQKRLKAYARHNPDQIMLEGESFNTAIDRLENFINTITVDEPSCLVAHRMIIEGFLARQFGIKKGEHEWLEPSSVTALKKTEGGIALLFFNRRYMDFQLWFETIKRKLVLC